MEQVLDEELSDSTPEEYEIASKGKRFGNLLLDYLGLFFVMFVIAMIKQIFRGPTEVSEFSEGSSDSPFEMNPILVQLLIAVVYSLILFGQEALMNGRTIGKWITGTKVLHDSGEVATVKTLFIRNLCRLIPFDALSFLGNRGWHDSFSNTVVVNSKPKR